MKSITYGEVNIPQIRNIVESRIHSGIESIEITVGTDSQSFVNFTKLVNVIAIRIGNRGGFFFYDFKTMPLITSLRHKLTEETSWSINTACELLEEIKHSEIKLLRDCKIVIHSDIGIHGPTNQLISEIVGWITASGFQCEIKPQSFAASTIADRLSK